MVDMFVTITADTCERIHRICEKFQCQPGHYIDALVGHDQHLPPQERLAMEYDLMVKESITGQMNDNQNRRNS